MRNRATSPSGPSGPSTTFTNPLQGGVIGRTDQGVDISARPGAAAYDPVPGESRLVGVIPNWFKGQPFYWFKVTSGAFKDKFWYAAEQIRVKLKPGDTTSQGQQIGNYAPSGTATEWGWATASGATLAHATTGYREGQQTPAGVDFSARVRGAKQGGNVPGSGVARPGGAPAGAGVTQTFTDYENLRDLPREAPGSPNAQQSFNWWYSQFQAAAGKVFNSRAPASGGNSPGSGHGWRVRASQESDGGQGACGPIGSGGLWYSELSTVPMGTASNFAALGKLPCGTALRITNPANGKSVIAHKRDVGAGSAFLPVMGLYPATSRALGLAGGAFTVVIERVDGGALHPVRGKQV